MVPAIAAALIPLAKPLIGWIEGLITKNKGGSDRMAMLVQIGRTIGAKLIESAGSGLTPEDLPADKELQAFFEPIFREMKANGQLTQTPATPGELYLVRGTIVKMPALP